MRAVSYSRVSSEEQLDGYSIDAQIRATRQFAQDRGWVLINEYIDEGKSARSDDINNRPQFKEMLKSAGNGEFDILIVHKLDRFSRNLMATFRSFEELANNNITFTSISEQLDYTTPIGRVFLAMAGAFAQFYSDNLSQETKKGWHERRKQGLYCGTLPFGAVKGKDGIPVPDMQDRKVVTECVTRGIKNFEGLEMAFELAAMGKSDREVAMALNAQGYRTTGTHGSRPFSKDTVKDMLKNRFYIGELTDGNGGYIKAKHSPLIGADKFEQVQTLRRESARRASTVNVMARVYSLSSVTRCGICGGHIRMQTNSKGMARVYCANKAKGSECTFKGTFLFKYETQIEHYLSNFYIPDDYQEQIVEYQRKLCSNYDKNDIERKELTASIERLKKQFRWGHISEVEYLKDFREAQSRLNRIPPEPSTSNFKQLASLLGNVAKAWKLAKQDQKNKLAKALFQEILLGDGGVVMAVKPREEFEPFFKMSYQHHRDIAGDPGGI